MKKLVNTAIIAGISIAVLTGCGTPKDVSTGAANNVEKTSTTSTASQDQSTSTSSEEKHFKANVSGNFIGVNVSIAEIAIKKDKIEVGLNLKNTNSDQINWYPDQEGKIVVGDMQLSANMFMGGQIGGQIAGGVKQDGVLVFPTPNNKVLDVKSIKSLKLDLGKITSSDFTKDKQVSFEIPVK